MQKFEIIPSFATDLIMYPSLTQYLLFSLFPKVSNESTKRHFSKIMANILGKNQLNADSNGYESIASTCVDWIINSNVKVAVQVWAIESTIN